MATIADLKDQIWPGPHPILACYCGAEYSANKADYFLLPNDHEFVCECGEILDVVVVETICRKIA